MTTENSKSNIFTNPDPEKDVIGHILDESKLMKDEDHKKLIEEDLIKELLPYMRCGASVRPLIDAINENKITLLTIKY